MEIASIFVIRIIPLTGNRFIPFEIDFKQLFTIINENYYRE